MNYRTLLQEHGLKATPQRMELLSIIQESGHISVDDMYLEIKKKYSSISLATLYKNIHAMMDSTLLQEIKIPHQKPKYEIQKNSHGHLLCKQCGSITDVPLQTNTLMNTMVKEDGFTPEDIHVVVSGVCLACQDL